MSCERCAQLEEELAYLRSELGIGQNGDALQALKRAYGAAPNTARMIMTLYRACGRVVSQNVLEDSLLHETDDPEFGFVKVYIHRARKALGRGSIENLRSVGYAMTPMGLAQVNAALQAC